MQRSREVQLGLWLRSPPEAVGKWDDGTADNSVGNAARAEQGRRIYRRLVRETLRGAIATSLELTAAQLGPALIDEYLERFLGELGPRARYLRHVTREFLAFCQGFWVDDSRLPRWLHELADIEQTELELLAQAVFDGEEAEIRPDRPLRFSQASRLLHYDHSVHLFMADPATQIEPQREATRLFAYRDEDYQVRYLELSPLTEAILRKLLAGSALGAALGAAVDELGTQVTDQVLDGYRALLSQLIDAGVVTGGTTPAEAKRETR